MQFIQFTAARDDTGQVLPRAKCTVYLTGTSTPAALFDANGNPVSNPVTADTTGNIGIAAANGTYDAQIVSADGLYTFPSRIKLQIFDMAAVAQALASGTVAGLVSKVKDTLANLNADLAAAANTLGLVYADSTPSNNDLYVKIGASGSGSWQGPLGVLSSQIASSVSSATASAGAAAGSATAASGSATAASGSATAAAGSASAASSSASAASSSATAADSSATAALGYANAASSSAGTAAAAVTAAAGSATAAAGSATAAAGSSNAALAAATAAAGSASAALTYSNSASAAAGQAYTYQAQAGSFASNASATQNAIQALINGYPGSAGQTIPVATRAAAKAISAPAGSFFLYEAGREGSFIVDSYATVSALFGADPQEGVWFQSTADPTKAFVRKAHGGILNPYMFGSLGGYKTAVAAMAGIDDTAACQALLNFWKNNPWFTPDFMGLYWGISSEITIQQLTGYADEQSPARMYGGVFVPLTGTTGARIVTVNAPGLHIKGHLGAIGNGDPTSANTINYANRGWDYGIYLVDSAMIRIDSWSAANVKRWGLDSTSEDMAHLGDQTNGSGSNIGAWVGPGNAFNCGSAAGQANSSCLTYAFDTVVFNNAAGGVTQTCTVHFTTPLDTKLQKGDEFIFTETASFAGCGTTSGSKVVSMPNVTGLEPGLDISGPGIPAGASIASVDSANQITLSANATATSASVTIVVVTKRTAYSISSVDFVGNTITFYFWLPSYTASGGTMQSAHGGFLHVHGANSGIGNYGRVEGIRAGVGCKDSGLYASRLGDIHVEASGICHVVGAPPNGASYGGATATLHCESTYLLLVHRGITPSGRFIGPVSANGKGDQPGARGWWRQFYHQRPRYSDDKLSNYGTHGLIFTDGNGAVIQNEGGPGQFESAAAAFTLSNRPHEREVHCAYAALTTPTLTLDWYNDTNEMATGKNWMRFELQGSSAGRNAMSQVTVQLATALLAAGWTLNGGTTSVVYTNMRGPCIGFVSVDVASKNMKIFVPDLQPAGLGGTTVTTTDAALSLNAATSTRFQIWDVAVAANRTITLQTTNAKSGDLFYIERTAASTGNALLNVGTGPLAALFPGDSCIVVYDGTAWRLFAYFRAGPSVQVVTTAATVTPTFSNDQVNITAQGTGLTLANPTGTAVPGKEIWIRIRDNGTARSIAFGTQYRAVGATLPTTTVISKLMYIRIRYNSDDTKWDVLDVRQEA